MKAYTGQIMVRQFDQGTGLAEHGLPFATLDELYRACLAINAPLLVDRIVLRGQDEAGHDRVLTFVFQSMTVTPQDE